MDNKQIFFKNEFYTLKEGNAPKSKILTLTSKDSSGEVLFYDLFDGISLAFIDIHATIIPAFSEGDNIRLNFINYCLDGRCEVNLKTGMSTCVSEGEICISTNSQVNTYTYPRKHYTGIELFFYIDKIEQCNNLIFDKFGIDLTQIFNCYCSATKPYISTLTPKMEQQLKEIYFLKNDEGGFKTKISVMNFLFLLAQNELPLKTKSKIFLTPTQIEIVKFAEKIVSENLQMNHTVLSLARRCSVSESSFKNYFKAYYGQSITEYVKDLRLTEAAKQLINTDRKILEIANEVGYENASKFASAFKTKYKVLPLEYRRLQQIH